MSLFDSPSSLLSAFVFATIGGLAVLGGLALEKFSDWLNERFLGGYKPHKWSGEIGWWILMAGIVIETGVAGGSAISQWQNDPLKKPIASASARARIIFKLNEKDNHPFAFFESSSNDFVGWNASIRFASGTNGLLVLEAGQPDVAVWNMGSENERECRIVFKENPFNFLETEDSRNIPVKQFNSVDSFFVYVAELPTNVVVVTGNVYLAVNDSKWTFDIPPQKPQWGLITMQKTKNSEGTPEVKILRVPISDFVYPPRFTNRWYDGQ